MVISKCGHPKKAIMICQLVILTYGVKQHASPNISKNTMWYVQVPTVLLMSEMCYIMQIRKTTCTFYSTHHGTVLCKVLCYQLRVGLGSYFQLAVSRTTKGSCTKVWPAHTHTLSLSLYGTQQGLCGRRGAVLDRCLLSRHALCSDIVCNLNETKWLLYAWPNMRTRRKIFTARNKIAVSGVVQQMQDRVF